MTSTEGFNQIDGDGDGKRQTHWPSDGGKPSANNTEVVVLKDLKNNTTTTTTTSDNSRPSITGEDTFDAGLPYDGRRSNSRATSRQHTRLNSSHSLSSQSKEILLRKPTS